MKPLLLRAKYFCLVGRVRPEMVTGYLPRHPLPRTPPARPCAFCALRSKMAGNRMDRGFDPFRLRPFPVSGNGSKPQGGPAGAVPIKRDPLEVSYGY